MKFSIALCCRICLIGLEDLQCFLPVYCLFIAAVIVRMVIMLIYTIIWSYKTHGEFLSSSLGGQAAKTIQNERNGSVGVLWWRLAFWGLMGKKRWSFHGLVVVVTRFATVPSHPCPRHSRDGCAVISGHRLSGCNFHLAHKRDDSFIVFLMRFFVTSSGNSTPA